MVKSVLAWLVIAYFLSSALFLFGWSFVTLMGAGVAWHRSRYRFSVRAMFVVTALLAVILTLLSRR